MNRRELLKMIALVTGGAVVGGEFLLAGCKNPDAGTGIVFSEADIAFLDEVAETIFPKTSTPGAKEAGLGKFMTVMVGDTYQKEDQDAFYAGIKSIDEASENMFEKKFMGIMAEDRKKLLISVDNERAEFQKNKPPGTPNHYFQYFKQLTIFGFFTSEVGRKGATRYEPVPGKYIGDLDYKRGEKVFTGLD